MSIPVTPVPSLSSPAVPVPAVHGAIAEAARATGTDFEFLLKTAARESSLDPGAKAKASSAAGLFQFLEQTWLGLVARHGARHGLADEAAAISLGTSGRYEIADPARRAEVLALRFSPEHAARMAGEMAKESAAALAASLGRTASRGELYAAHFLGATGAARLIAAAETAPDGCAADLFPEAAAANRAIFYEADGTARSAAEVLARVACLPDAKHGTVAAALLPAPSGRQAAPERQDIPEQAARAKGDRPTFARSHPPLTLTPEVLEILASLDPLAMAEDRPGSYRRMTPSRSSAAIASAP